MAQFNLEIGGSGVPVTLSSLSERYLLKSWKKLNYSGYQPSQKYLLGDVSLTQTPKGMFNLGELALTLLLLHLATDLSPVQQFFLTDFSIKEVMGYLYRL